ncbi:hypothetical protein GCM10018785_27410 [Streptomyces longispororuber]|uniref:Uncharacterized protein n=1 Tax=Streptomyces longispororuber TaxID=68230 RepID=A0A919DM66_9ACTN|nr:hypothetical protein GCM10018785_27410 [Streptomyces longispororuber]
MRLAGYIRVSTWALARPDTPAVSQVRTAPAAASPSAAPSPPRGTDRLVRTGPVPRRASSRPAPVRPRSVAPQVPDPAPRRAEALPAPRPVQPRRAPRTVPPVPRPPPCPRAAMSPGVVCTWARGSGVDPAVVAACRQQMRYVR